MIDMSEVELNSDEIVYLIMGLTCAVDYAVLTPESVKDLQSKLNREFRKQTKDVKYFAKEQK
jgi:hypothetical protein